ncbi:PREDICTED: uncharacterized protein LOC104819026 [Tarenaya hassleriana]|uniref:uncharacterized protein LOC104819026 n=1 Tax=Tarenaya hassleriana TaxID=28532 RepID=UPI00053C623A|nr:PREDICTED: uncharacterized protein LOC104819026 [Tarenaya hassleriana]
MKVAEKIVFLWNDPHGFATAIIGALNPNLNSSLRILEEPFELPLDKYGIGDVSASGKIIHFVDENGVFQVSVLLLQSYEPPTTACAINELLDQITRGLSTLPTVVAPFLVAASKLKFQNRSLASRSENANLCYVQLGPETGISKLCASRIQRPPPLLQIHYEPLSCFLQLARVLRMPTTVLIGQRSTAISNKALEEELQVIHEIGELVASSTGLCFSRDGIKWNVPKTSKEGGEEKPWLSLYG